MRAGAKRILDAVRVSGPLWTASLVGDRILPVPVLRLWPDRAVPYEDLAAQLRTILRSWGTSAEHAEIAVGHILYADLHGIDSHGVGMLLHYHRGFVAGTLRPTAEAEVVSEGPTTALVDGGGGLGHVTADFAARLAIAKARESGIAAVAVRNSRHFGAAGAYAALAAQEGMIGIATTDIQDPAVVPTFGAEPMLGTNPIAFAAPAGRNEPFLLDMATTTASLGKALTAWRQGRRIPAGWAVDRKGRPIRNGRRAADGRRLTPLGSRAELGSYKGYGLAAMVEVLSSLLPGARDSAAPFDATKDGLGHFFCVLDPGRFRPAGDFESDVDGMVDALRASEPLDPAQPVLVAGDPERAAAAERRRTGIPLSRAVFEDVRGIARASGVPFLLG